MVDKIQKQKFAIMLIITLALGLRLVYIASISEKPINSKCDEKDYNNLALNLVTGKGYVDLDSNPTSRRAPLAPMFFALMYAISGYSITAVRIAQAFLGTLTCFIIYLLGKSIFSRKVGLASAAIAAIYPSFIVFSGKLLSETLLIFLLVLAMYFLLKKEGSIPINSSLSGLLFGLASLTRPSISLLPLAMFFISVIFKTATLKEITKKFLIVIIVMFIIITPWTVRNYCVHKEFVLINSQFGYSLLASYFYPDKGFGFFNSELYDSLTEGVDNQLERNRILAKYVIDNIIKNPYKFIKLLPLKFLWFWEPFGGKDYGFDSSYNIVYGLIFLFFLFGLVRSHLMWKDLLPFYAAIGYFILVSLIIYGSRRFRMQIEPFIIILASYGIFWVLGRWRTNRIISTVLIIGLISNLLFFFLADNIKVFSKKVAGIFGYTAFSEDK